MMMQGVTTYSRKRKANGGTKRRKYSSPSPRVVLVQSRGELKGMDTQLYLAAGSVLSTTTNSNGVLPVNLVQQGTLSSSRIGRKIKIKSLRLTIPWELHANIVSGTGIISDNILRVTVIWDKQPSGALPNYSEMFGRKEQDGSESSQVLDNLNYDNTDRFQVLSDTKIPSRIGTDGGNGMVCIGLHERYIKVGRETVFSSASTPMTISDISSGGLYVIFRALYNTADNRYVIPTEAIARLRYTDI